jgi:signal transduction histidine kinase
MQQPALTSQFVFLAGGGEMGERMRRYDWQRTPLGPPQQWPQSLRSMVSLVLLSKFPMVLFWGDDYIQLYNDAYRPSLGQAGKHPLALGQAGPACWPEIWSSFAQPLFEQIRQTQEAVYSENQLVPIYRNGQQEDAYWTYTYLPVLDEADQVGGILAIVHETTQSVKTTQHLQQRTAELARANSQLRGLNANLQEFAYVASHDLQEPLRKIQQFGDLLKTRYADSVGEGLIYIERMQSAAQRMSSLIKDLLDFSRISTQREISGSVSLPTVVEEVVSTLELQVEQLGAQIRVGPLPTVLGDASQLGQLFQNLLSNALKFHRPGQAPLIAIEGRWLSADQLPPGVKPGRAASAYHQIAVMDNGIGFEEKYVDRIFQVFQRLHGKSEYAGTGIGLAICEKVVANHGGAIKATSQPGQGATFAIYLPA